MPDQRLSGENQSQNVDGPDDIILGDHEQWKQIDHSQWELEEDERNLLRENNVSVQQWLQGQGNSQPARDIFINSQSLPQRKRETHKLLVHIDDVFSDTIKPPSIQAAKSSNNTILGLRNPTTSNVNTTSINEQLFNRSVSSAPSLQQFSAAPDRNIRYCENGYNRERSSSTLASYSRPAFSIASHGHQAGGGHAQATGLSFQQTARSVTGTDTSAGSKKPPKRQNSHSMDDDDASSKRTFPRRNRSRGNTQSYHAPPPSSSAPRRMTQPSGNNSLQTSIEGTRVPPHQVRNNASPFVSGDSSLLGPKQNKPPPRREDKVLSHEHFTNLGELCPFWLFDPIQFSNVERQACCGRKEEMSHVVTHLAHHHGFVRGKDPKNASRTYLASCQTHNSSVKAKGDCSKCISLHKWKDSDFADPEHKGVVLCLRCWFKFDKREMQSHLAGSCPYRAEQPKPKKMCMLYTTFCSPDKPPSSPPKNMAPRKTKPRSSPKRRNRRSTTQQVENNTTYRSAPEQASQLLRPAHPQAPCSQVKPNTTHESTSSTSSHADSFIERDEPISHEFHETQNRPSVPGDSFERKEADSHQSNPQPIALIYPDTPVEYIADLYKKLQRDRQQGVVQSIYSPMTAPSSFGNGRMGGTAAVNGFQQQKQPQVQNGLRLPNQYSNWQQPSLQIPQISSRILSQPSGHTSQQGFQDKSLEQFPQQSLTQPQYPQQLSSQHLPHEYLSVQNRQTSTNANFPTYHGRTPQLLRSPNTPQLQLQVPATNDLDTTISLSGGLSQVQSSPSRVASTAGESMCLLQSPNPDAPLWLFDDYDYEDTSDWLKFDTVGSHPQLQKSFEVGDPPPLQTQQSVGDLKPDSRILAVQQTAVEKDSGYHSNVFDDLSSTFDDSTGAFNDSSGTFNDMDWDPNDIFSS
ncbi:hypothetical protein FVEN_g1485 [Fusarium venenatum]|uniref:Uncharacterized protein n=2 Tax=Fusarium venenatum TaxID=56646 RepID=A0A2L2TJT2_9HYPO|nr:uncharacterized protein FVRRES_13308 [Fusarium venenatum]KAG8360754.1 hypothetical protein FVEN_g1485 [Fusarium venenatum]CEI40858.1 unnamed protein product [Fusarium venenatum]